MFCASDLHVGYAVVLEREIGLGSSQGRCPAGVFTRLANKRRGLDSCGVDS